MYELIIILSLFIAINFTVHITSLHVRFFFFYTSHFDFIFHFQIICFLNN